jgi:hypothetical protein
MKRNRPSVRHSPPVVKGIYSVSPNWVDVVLADIAYLWRRVFK